MGKEVLDQLLKHFTSIKGGPTGNALRVTQHGKVIYTGYCGKADIRTGREIDENTLYRMYSCSKVLTATALMLLLERGIVQLDDPVKEFLPEYKDAVYCRYTGNNLETYQSVKSLTLRHLITMTSGLTYGGTYNSTQRAVKEATLRLQTKGNYTTRDFAKEMASVPLAFEPGLHWNYGVGHDVLGAAIEVISGKNFGVFLKENIFDPLKMENTFFQVPDEKFGNLAANMHLENGEMVANTGDDAQFRMGTAYQSGGGGIVSSLHDYARFGAMLSMGGTLDGVRVMGRKTIDLMRQNQLCPSALKDFQNTHANGWEFMTGYGYGLGVKTLLDQPASGCMGSLGEFSWAGAAGTLLSIDPSEEVSIVYMHQVMPNNMEGYCHPRIKNAVNGQLL